MAKIRVKHCKEALLEIDTITPRDVSQSLETEAAGQHIF